MTETVRFVHAARLRGGHVRVSRTRVGAVHRKETRRVLRHMKNRPRANSHTPVTKEQRLCPQEMSVKGFLDQLAGGDAAIIVAMFTDDAVIDMPGGDDMPWAGRGRAGRRSGVLPGPAGGACHARARHQDLGRRRRHRPVNGEEAGSSKISGKQYRAKWCLGLHPAGRQDRPLGRLRDTQVLSACGPWR